MKIPLVDLKLQHALIADEVSAGLSQVMADTAFILGPQVGEFEAEFARFQEAPHCVGVGSGTDALEMALRALGVGAGDEVILPANTFIATALAVSRTGAVPVLVDCDPEHHLIDIQRAEEAVGSRTRAIIPVHLYGQLAPMEQLLECAVRHDLVVIEDAAQAHGARRHGKTAGSFGLAAGFSFYPGKNLGAYGDAGAVITHDADVHNAVRRLRNWGSDRKYHHPEMGFNSRLDTLQSVVLLAKLRHLATGNQHRREAAELYDELLVDIPEVSRPSVLEGNEPVWHLYVVRVAERDRVLQYLNARGIGAGIHYPIPIHLQGAYADLRKGPGSFPVAEQAANEILSLPMFAGITEAQQQHTIEILGQAVAGRRRRVAAGC